VREKEKIPNQVIIQRKEYAEKVVQTYRQITYKLF